MTLLDLADACRSSGLKVVEVPGWRTRGRPGTFAPRGVLNHHTATSPTSRDSDVVDLLVRGHSTLTGPLCQIGFSRDATAYVVAAGRANHAGRAESRQGVPAGDGNALWLGIEAFNSGFEGWGSVQLNGLHRLNAALCDWYRWPRSRVAAHAETSTEGKWDPGVSGRVIDMADFRRSVAAAGTPSPAPPESEEDDDMYFCVYSVTGKRYTYTLGGPGGFNNTFNNGDAGALASDYANGVAAAFRTGTWRKVSESHRRSIAASLDAVRLNTVTGDLSVTITEDAS